MSLNYYSPTSFKIQKKTVLLCLTLSDLKTSKKCHCPITNKPTGTELRFIHAY